MEVGIKKAEICSISKDLGLPWDRTIEELKKIGLEYVTLDLEGYRSGSMDKAL
jgi:2-iminoacetate synthase ThiH